jgi:hypothetical protein
MTVLCSEIRHCAKRQNVMGKAKKTTMKQILVILLTFFTFQVSGQKIRPEIKNLVQKIEKYNVLESEHVGIAGETTDQYRNFIKLRDKATIDELLQLLEYKNSVVKGYTSWTLADKMYPNLANMLAEFLRTGETATTQHGCIVSEGDLATEFYNRVFYQHFHRKLTLTDSLFFQGQIQHLDSVILYSKNESYLLRNALLNNNGNPQNYDRIRQLAFNEKNPDAIEALAIYQKKEDIVEFKKLKELSFLAISKFPDSQFWEFLLSFKSKEITINYLMGVSAFKSKESAKLISEILSNSPEEKIESFSEAITKNYCLWYQDIILSIWEKYKIIDIRATTQIIKDIPKKSAISFSVGLLSSKELNFVQYDYDYGTSDKILPMMLESIKGYDKDNLIKICKQNIRTAKFTNLEHFLNFVTENKMVETSDEIIGRLQNKNIPFEIFHLTETVLSFNNPNIKEKLIAILKTNQKDWDLGNWSDHFRKLFKQYDIQID